MNMHLKVLFNDNIITMHKDFAVQYADHSLPGDWDELHYRNQTFTTYECDTTYTLKDYIGNYAMMCDDGSEINFKSLDAAMIFLDAYPIVNEELTDRNYNTWEKALPSGY